MQITVNLWIDDKPGQVNYIKEMMVPMDASATASPEPVRCKRVAEPVLTGEFAEPIPVTVAFCVVGLEMRTPGIGREAELQADTNAETKISFRRITVIVNGDAHC